MDALKVKLVKSFFFSIIGFARFCLTLLIAMSLRQFKHELDFQEIFFVGKLYAVAAGITFPVKKTKRVNLIILPMHQHHCIEHVLPLKTKSYVFILQPARGKILMICFDQTRLK